MLRDDARIGSNWAISHFVTDATRPPAAALGRASDLASPRCSRSRTLRSRIVKRTEYVWPAVRHIASIQELTGRSRASLTRSCMRGLPAHPGCTCWISGQPRCLRDDRARHEYAVHYVPTAQRSVRAGLEVRADRWPPSPSTTGSSRWRTSRVGPARLSSPALTLTQHHAGEARCSVCSGADALGSAGLLDGRRFTTHHELQDEMPGLPAAQWSRMCCS